MSDKTKPLAVPPTKTTKIKRPSTVSVASSSSRVKVQLSTTKEKRPPNRLKIDKNATILGDADVTMMKQEGSIPDFDAEYRQIAYGKYLRAMLEDCLVDEKIEREETQMDIQMCLLADRFKNTMNLLDKTSRRLKDVSFVVEQKRLLDLKNNDCARFYEMTDASNAQEVLHNLTVSGQSCLDTLETKNIDFGYDKNSGHKQLLDAVNEAIDGLEQIKKHSDLDMNKFEEYEKCQKGLEDLEKDRLDLASLKTDLDTKFPNFNEKLLKEASEKIAKMFDNDDGDD